MADLARVERQRIAEITYVPDAAARHQLYAKATLAEAARAGGVKMSLLLSKMADKPFAVPAKLVGINDDGEIDPDATVLATFGRKGGEVGDKSVLTVMNDRDMPLMLTSFGANAVLTDCQLKYGANRMNLFYRDDAETLRLLSDYLQMRDQNSSAMLSMFVKKLNAHHAGPPAYAIDLAKGNYVLDADREVVYDSIVELFVALQCAHTGTSLASVGLGMRSFCQTWMRGEVKASCLKPISNLSRTYLKPISNLSQTYLKPISNLSQTYLKPISHPRTIACAQALPPLSGVDLRVDRLSATRSSA